MSIKGFTVDGQDYQYNYPNLDNIPEITPESIGAASQEDFSAFEEEVESQIEQNKDDISALKSASYNLIDPIGITPYQSTSAAELTRTGFVIHNTTEATYSRGYLYLNLKPNTEYTFSAKKHTTSGVAYVGYSEAPGEGEPFPSANIPLIGRTAPDDETLTKTFTTTTGILVIRFYAAWDTAELGEVEYSEIMVVEGSEEKPYVRHVFAQDDEARNAINDLQTGLDQKAGILRNTASGAIVSFMPDASVKDLLGLTVAVEPVQEGSGDPSPDNVRPISGWTGANIHISPTTDAADGDAYSITFPSEAGTVYGGTLNVTTGKLTVTQWKFDMGIVTYTESSTYAKRFAAFFPAGKGFPTWERQNAPSGMLICSIYKEKSYQEVWVNGQNAICAYYTNSGMRFGVCEPTSQNAEDFRQAVAGQTIVYKLATPIVYYLAPQTIETIKGQINNVWADAGDVTVDFAEDIKTYIDNKFAELQALALENS